MTSNNLVPNYNSKNLHKKALFDGLSREIIDLIQRSLRNVQAIVDADECSLTLLEPEEPALFTYSTRQGSDGRPDRTSLHSDEKAAWIAQQQAAPNIDNEVCAPHRVPSQYAIPLVEHDIFVGVLSIRSSALFDDRKIKMLPLLANQVGLTLGNRIRIGRELGELERSRIRFFSTMAHDLRAPLNSINGYLELALAGTGGALNEEQYEFIQRARAGSEQLYALLENLLFISRVDNGQLKLKREVINLQDVIDNAIEELELSQRDQNVLLALNVAQDIKLYADSVRLQQVLRNLLSNALNFTPSGGRITIHALFEGATSDPHQLHDEQEEEKMGVLKLQVQDSGFGIAPEYHTQIFERYFQVPNESRGRAGGPGLGLTIVKHIIELHGGSVFVDSIPGQGSTFTCTLPCVLY